MALTLFAAGRKKLIQIPCIQFDEAARRAGSLVEEYAFAFSGLFAVLHNIVQENDISIRFGLKPETFFGFGGVAEPRPHRNPNHRTDKTDPQKQPV